MPSRPGRLAMAVGVDGMGAGGNASGYTAVSGYVGPVEITVGYAQDINQRAFLAGLDGNVTEQVILMADYKSRGGDAASAGFQYTFGRHWLTKIGIRFDRNLEASRIGAEIKYFNTY